MTKKNIIAILLIGLLLVFVILIVYKALHKKPAAAFSTEMPAFALTTLEGGLFTSDSLHAGKTVMVFYAPGCLFCEHEGKELARHAADFAGSQFLFITCALADSAAAYSLRTGIHAIPHFYSLVDAACKTPRPFGLRTTPTTLLYDENRRLIKGIEGEVNAVKLRKMLQEYEPEK